MLLAPLHFDWGQMERVASLRSKKEGADSFDVSIHPWPPWSVATILWMLIRLHPGPTYHWFGPQMDRSFRAIVNPSFAVIYVHILCYICVYIIIYVRILYIII